MSSFALKILAMIFMLLDHIGFLLFPDIEILRFIGRLAFPIFAFQVGIGFEHSKNRKKYIGRMILFTFISQIPFQMFTSDNDTFIFNIGATLLCGLIILYSIEEIHNKWIKILSILSILVIGFFVPMDYGLYGILTVVTLYIFRNSKLIAGSTYGLILSIYCKVKNSIFNLPAIFSLVPIFLYNGKKGANIKYLFYIFYPLHLLILSFFK